MTYPAEAEVFRTEVRKILAEELPADWRGIGAIATEAETEDFVARWRAVLHRRGLLGITWPVEYGGRGLSQLHQVVLVEELTRAGLPFGRQPLEATGLKMLGNTLLRWGTDDQKARYLPGLLSGEIRFCQGFSEPSAGSDLASVRTRARLEETASGSSTARRSGRRRAMHCTHIFTLVRTDPDAPKHRGLTFLLVPLAQPGVEVRPIRHMAGRPGVLRGLLHRREDRRRRGSRPGQRRLGGVQDAAHPGTRRGGRDQPDPVPGRVRAAGRARQADRRDQGPGDPPAPRPGVRPRRGDALHRLPHPHRRPRRQGDERGRLGQQAVLERVPPARSPSSPSTSRAWPG